jgi:hypothetical protein
MSSCGFSSFKEISVVSRGFSGFLRSIVSEVVSFKICCVRISSSTFCSTSFTVGITSSVVFSNFFDFLIFFLTVTSVVMSSSCMSSSLREGSVVSIVISSSGVRDFSLNSSYSTKLKNQ